MAAYDCIVPLNDDVLNTVFHMDTTAPDGISNGNNKNSVPAPFDFVYLW